MIASSENSSFRIVHGRPLRVGLSLWARHAEKLPVGPPARPRRLPFWNRFASLSVKANLPTTAQSFNVSAFRLASASSLQHLQYVGPVFAAMAKGCALWEAYRRRTVNRLLIPFCILNSCNS
jgi:hypothetical protein